MKKIFAFLFFISLMCISAFAQSRIPEFEKAKQIKMLESNRKDVKKILAVLNLTMTTRNIFPRKTPKSELLTLPANVPATTMILKDGMFQKIKSNL